jgi:hypothetical protein
MLIQANEEKWTYTESLYFTFIGILTVGMSEKIDCRWLNLKFFEFQGLETTGPAQTTL